MHVVISILCLFHGGYFGQVLYAFCSVLRRVKMKEGACIDYIRCFIDVCLD